MDKENPTLEAFAPAVIKKNSAETDPRYQEHSYYYKADANGVPAADATFWLTIDRQNHYQARAEFSVVSPWAAIINAFGRQQVKGDIVNGKFRPNELKGLFVVRDKTIEVTVRYPKNGGQPKTTMNPPRNLATITPIDQQLLAQSYDITSALLTLMNRFQKNGQAAACGQNLITWDGWRLARLRLRPNPDDANTCNADFDRLGGFLKDTEAAARQKPATLIIKADKRFALPLAIAADTFFITPTLRLKEIDDAPLSYYYLPEHLDISFDLPR